MIIDLKRSIDLRWLLMSSAIFISDDLVHCYLTFWVSWYLWQNVQFKNIYIVDNLHAPGIFQAIFNHMGPNMARGWQGDSAGTKVIFFPSSCFCLGALNFCCNQISDFFCLISIISCYLGEAWRGATWQQNCTNTKGSLFICSIYRSCESSNCNTRVALLFWSPAGLCNTGDREEH